MVLWAMQRVVIFFPLPIFELKILPCSTARVILGQAFRFYMDLLLNFQLLFINIFKYIYCVTILYSKKCDIIKM